MDGEKVALWMQYLVDSNASPALSATLVFPTFRLLPVQTISHMMYNVEENDLPRFLINDHLFKAGVYNAEIQKGMPEKVVRITQNGIMKVYSEIGSREIKE